MRKVKPSYLVLIVLLLASVAFLAFTLNTARLAGPGRRGAARRPAAASTPGTESQALAPAAPANADFGRYQLVVTRDVFSPPKPPAPPPGPARQGLPPLTAPVAPAPEPSPRLSFPGWSYVGCIVINGKTRGVLQNEQTRSGMDVIVGDSFQGATVEQITPDEIRLRAGAAAVSLYLPADFPVLPLEKAGAPAAPGRPAQPPAPAQPG